MSTEAFTQFDYLLNAFEAASQADKPADHGYGDKRRALYAYVRDLERRLQEARNVIRGHEATLERLQSGLLRERLAKEVAQADTERLREDCAMVYQVIGAAMLGEPCDYTQDDVARALDNLSAACNGDPRPHEDLLPWPAATPEQ